MMKLVQSLRSKVQGRRQIAVRALLMLGLWTLDLGPWTPIAFAAFEDTGTGARPSALGGAYVSLGDDTQSLMYNPAGLAQLRQRELSSEYSRLYSGLSDGSNLSQFFMGYGTPVKYGGTMAFGWKQFSLDNLYVERTLSLGYGEWITERVAAGMALKQLYHSVSPPSIVVDNSGQVESGRPTFFQQNGNSNTAYAADIGALARLTPRHTLGLSIQDLNEPDIALSGEDRDRVPRTIRLGLTYKGDRHLTLSGALTNRKSLGSQQDTTWTGAAEKWWLTRDSGDFAARGSIQSGSRDFKQFAMGAAYRLNRFQLDYAFIFNVSGITLSDTMGTHRFSMAYRFVPPSIGPTLPRHAKKKPEPRKDTVTIDSKPATLGPWIDSMEEADGLPPIPATAAPVVVSTPAAPVAPPLAAPPVVVSSPVVIPPPVVIPVVETPKPVVISTPIVTAPAPIKPAKPAKLAKPAKRPAAAKDDMLTALDSLEQQPVAVSEGAKTGSRVPATYRVKAGDTLINLAERFYGDYTRWRDIYALNKDRLGRGGDLKPGLLLLMPKEK
jgi:hypothetical protein